MVREYSLDERRDASALSKFSLPAQRALRALLKSPVADKVLAEAEDQLVDERKALRADLAAAAKRRDEATAASQASVLAAGAALEEAERMLPILRQRYHQAVAASQAPEVAFLRESCVIVDALEASSDPRLSEFRWHLDEMLTTDVVAALVIMGNPARAEDRNAAAVVSNVEQVAAARSALSDAIKRVDAARLEALTSMEVSELMNAVCVRLAPVLAAIDLNPPSLTAENMEPGPPTKFGGASQWIVGERPTSSRDEKATRRAERKARIDASDRANG